jgi:hypothetical protein
MAFEVRDALRAKVIETLISTFPGAQKVVGGVAFHSDVVDEETGMLFPVELKVTVKNTKDTARSKAYDLDAEVQKAAERPGRRVADPAKKAEQEAAKAAAAERKAANVAILKDWVKDNLPAEGMLSSQILTACADLAHLNAMQIGTICAACADEGVLFYELDDKRRKVWHLATN